jgi:hypothetical protein
MNQRCVNMSMLLDLRGRCPSNESSLDCSGHGKCSNRFTCVCDRGWDSDDCSKVEEPEPDPTVTTHPTPLYQDIPVTRSQPQGVMSVTLTEGGGKEDTNYTLGMIFAIAVVTISILFFMCALIYCYLFASPGSKAKDSLDSQTDAYGMEQGAVRPNAAVPPMSDLNHVQMETHSVPMEKIMEVLNDKM